MHYLDSYARRNYRKVDGWLSRESIAQILRIQQIQLDLHIAGHVGEIGVHHGKLFILLYLLAREDENALAIDIFDRQELNVDQSGKGSLSILEKNLSRFAGGLAKLKIINSDSTALSGRDLTAAAGGALRLLSIDGGHLAQIVRHDLMTGSEAICDGGVIILDDYFNPEFPGVSEGVNSFFHADNRGRLVPFFVAMNKIYLTTREHAESYMDRFCQMDLGLAYKATNKFRMYDTAAVPIRVTEMFGADVLSYSPDVFGNFHRLSRYVAAQGEQMRRHLSDTAAWQRMRDTELGRMIRRVADKWLPY